MKKLIALGLATSLLLSMSVVAAAANPNAGGDAAIEFQRGPGIPPTDGVSRYGLTGADLNFGVHNIEVTGVDERFPLVVGATPPAVEVTAIEYGVRNNWQVTAELGLFSSGLQGAMLTLNADSQPNALGGARNVSLELVAGDPSDVFLSQNGAMTHAIMNLSGSTLDVLANSAATGTSQARLTFTFIPNAY